MTIRKQRNRPLRDSNYPTTPHGTSTTEWPSSDKTVLSSSDVNVIEQSAKTKLLTSTSNTTNTKTSTTAAKSAKMYVNFNNMFVDGTQDDKKNISTTNLQPPLPFLGNIKKGGGDSIAADVMSLNSDDNDYFYCPRRLSGGTHQHLHHPHNENDKLIVTPSQCKLKPAGLEFFDLKKQVNVINLQLNDKEQMKANVNCLTLLPQQLQQQRGSCHIKSKTRATQTLYRESSAQTLPYLPGVSNDPEELDNLEIFKLPTILPGDKAPGLYEVEVLERARKRWSFAKALKQNFRKQLEQAKQKAKLLQPTDILDAFEWEHWIEREEYIQECQMLRLEILIRMFDRREQEMHKASWQRIQKSCEDIDARRRNALKKNEIEYNRALRRLEIQHKQQPKVWRKEHKTQEFGDPSSEFYAPKMRYGVNPSRRHFMASRKGFDMRMDDLEKKAIKMDAKNLKCPFAKLKEWSKPKQVLKEVEQNFCSEENLKKLYESLRTLRESSRREKYTPLCLKVKEPRKPTIKPQQQTLQININDEISSNLKSPDSSSNASSIKSERSKRSRITSNDLEALEELRQQKQTERLNMEMLQKEMRCEELETLINSYEGHTIGWLMRFLSEEMSRLKEQRKLHFFTMIAKRERWHREAAEAGLRQKENCMREEYEQLYQECNQINKEISKKFLDSILQEDIKDYAEQKAEQHVTLMAKELDKEISAWLESFKEMQNPLNYHALRHALKDIVMPDIDKILYGLERDDCINYIINDVLLPKVYHSLESYDISFVITNDLVDRLIDNDLYLNSNECSSDCECTYFCCCSRSRQEAAAIIRKIIRYAVPGRRWLTEEERITFENVRDLLDDIFNQVITQESIFEIEMAKSPDVHDQKAHTDLVCSARDLCIKYNSEERLSLEADKEIKIKRLDSLEGACAMDITKHLRFDEQLLLEDPDKLSADRFVLYKDEYVIPEPKIEPQHVHVVPSTHDISCAWNFDKTPMYAQTSSEELLETMLLEQGEEDIQEEMLATQLKSDETNENADSLELEISSSHEACEEEPTEEEDVLKQEEFTIAIKESSESAEPSYEPPAQFVRFAELPEENIFEVEPVHDEDDDGGVMEVSFSYDPNVKYSVPVPSSHDMVPIGKEEKQDIEENNEN